MRKLGFAKKIIFAVFGAATFLGLSRQALADAVPEFNNNSGDHQLIRVKNVTQGESEYKNNTDAENGDVLRFNIWVHNNVENSTAENVIVRAELNSQDSLSQIVKAFVSAGNASGVNGSTTVALDKEGHLEYTAGSTLVYSDVFGNGYAWPNDNLVGGGINLGDVKGCWPYVVQITFEAKVKAKTEEENPRLTVHKQVSYGDERKNGHWFDSISRDAKIFGPGEYLYYRVTVENVGKAKACDVTLEDQLPPYLRKTGGDGSYDSGANIVSVSLGDIAAGAKVVVEYQLRVRETLPNGDRTQENSVVVKSSNYQDLYDSTVVWIRGPETIERKREEVEIVTTTVEIVEREVVERLPETGGNFLIPNLLISLGSLITGLGLKKLG